MKLVFHVLLALGLVALMRKHDEAVVLAVAGCIWMGVTIATSVRPLLREAAPEARAASLAQTAGWLLLGLVTAFLVYGLAEQALTLPAKLRMLASNGRSNSAGAAIVGWALQSAWLLMAAAPTLARTSLAGRAGTTASILPPAWGLLGACLAGPPVGLCWAHCGDAWARGFLSYSDVVDGLPLLAPTALPLVAGAELWRRSLAARGDRIEARGLLRVVLLGAAVACLVQAGCMAVEIARVSALPNMGGARSTGVRVGGVFLIGQAAAWIVATYRLRRTPDASLPRTLLACVVLFTAMLLAAIPPGAVLAAADWAALAAVMLFVPWVGCLALSQTLVLWLVTRITGDAAGPRLRARPA